MIPTHYLLSDAGHSASVRLALACYDMAETLAVIRYAEAPHRGMDGGIEHLHNEADEAANKILEQIKILFPGKLSKGGGE